jgi:hypothetical protein
VDGNPTESSWLLREKRFMEEGSWWTDKEIEGYQDRMFVYVASLMT